MNYKEKEFELGAWWFMLLRRQRSEGSVFKTSSGKHFIKPYLEKTQHTHTHTTNTHTKDRTGPQGFMLILLATQEAEIRKIAVQSQPRQTVHETLSQKKNLSQKRVVEWFKV
jgi:hypothetical protein